MVWWSIFAVDVAERYIWSSSRSRWFVSMDNFSIIKTSSEFSFSLFGNEEVIKLQIIQKNKQFMTHLRLFSNFNLLLFFLDFHPFYIHLILWWTFLKNQNKKVFWVNAILTGRRPTEANVCPIDRLLLFILAIKAEWINRTYFLFLIFFGFDFQ